MNFVLRAKTVVILTIQKAKKLLLNLVSSLNKCNAVEEEKKKQSIVVIMVVI